MRIKEQLLERCSGRLLSADISKNNKYLSLLTLNNFLVWGKLSP